MSKGEEASQQRFVRASVCVRVSACEWVRASMQASVWKREREEGEGEKKRECEEGKNWSYFAFFLPALPACSLHYKTRPSNILRAVYMHMCVWMWVCVREKLGERGREGRGRRVRVGKRTDTPLKVSLRKHDRVDSWMLKAQKCKRNGKTNGLILIKNRKKISWEKTGRLCLL